MTENQIKYIYDNHKKYLSVFFGITEQAVFKWGQRGKMPDKYKQVLDAVSENDFFNCIFEHEQKIVFKKVDNALEMVKWIK